MNKVTRRAFVAGMGAAAVLPPAALLNADWASQTVPPAATASYRFFQPHEASFIEPACERLIPNDHDGPGAFGPEIAAYMDRQLAGPWGAGERLYRTGPWQPGSLPAGAEASNPATLFRTALRAIDRGLASRGTGFGELDPLSQASFLRSLASDGSLLDGVPATAFFELLLSMTVEAFFSSSTRAEYRGTIAWPLKSFPGSYFRESVRSR